MVPYIQLENVKKSFGDLVLYENINMTVVEKERIALIAKNGAGKTTLLNIIAGKEKPDSGEVIFRNGIKVGFLEQQPELPGNLTVLNAVFHSGSEIAEVVRRYEKAVFADDKEALEHLIPEMERLSAWDYGQKAKEILSRLNVTDMDKLVGKMSGGEKKRVALAAMLIDDPEVIIMDEPTNHLDLEMVEWLEDFLIKSNKTVLLVTHDRYFLDRICTAIYEIDQKKLYRYSGNYADYIVKRDDRIVNFNTEVDKAQNLFRRELEWMRRMPQARGTKAKYRKDAFYDLKNKAFAKRDDGKVDINIQSSRLGTKIFEVKGLNKSFGDRDIIKDFDFTFTRYQKLGIVGKNGTGKSTFLNILTGSLEADSGIVDVGDTVKFGYYRQQEIDFEGNKKVIDVVKEIAEVVTLGDGNTITASQFLNKFLFPPETQYNYIYKLSGGEKRRLYLLTVLMRSPNFLILDEPTNDLDIVTLNVLEDYLVNFGGCIIIVSHDRYFMDKVAEQLLVFEGGGEIRSFPENYTEYRNRQEELKESEESKKIKTQPVADRRPDQKDKPKKLSYKEKLEYESLEKEIEDLESEKKNLEEALNSGMLEAEELNEKSRKIGEVMELIDEKYMRWLELSELA